MRIQVLAVFFLLGIASAANISLPGCQDICGNVTIPYPFGIGEGCYLDPGFEITCNDSSYATPKAFIGSGNIEVRNISPEYMRAHYGLISYECYNESNQVVDSSYPSFVIAKNDPYRFSDTRNKFTGIGCSTLAFIIGKNGDDSNTTSGCISVCYSQESTTNGLCSGLGCCQTSIPKDLYSFEAGFNGYNHTYGDIWKFSPCSYGMLIEQDWYNFTVG